MLNSKTALTLLCVIGLLSCSPVSVDLDIIAEEIGRTSIKLENVEVSKINHRSIILSVTLENDSNIDVCTLFASEYQVPVKFTRHKDGAVLYQDDYKIFERDNSPEPYDVERIAAGASRVYRSEIEMGQYDYFSFPDGRFGGRFEETVKLTARAELPLFSCDYLNAKTPINNGDFVSIKSLNSVNFNAGK